jgi:23S rRNA pseudouridine2457 synthase
MVSQFVSPHAVKLLGDVDFNFPEGTHAIGRLDNNSEGLLLLTTDKTITRRLFLGPVAHKRTYLVQINNHLSKEHLLQLQQGTSIKVNNNEWYTTPPCDVQIVEDVKMVYPFAENTNAYGPHTWLLITLTEGKYHQVRKMIGSIKHRCKRLIRVSIEDMLLGSLPPGMVKEMNEKDFCTLLNI